MHCLCSFGFFRKKQFTDSGFLIQLVLEGLRARQVGNSLLMEKRTMARALEQANASVGFCEMKATRIDDQVFRSSVYIKSYSAISLVVIVS